MTNSPDDPWSPLNEDFETPEYDDRPDEELTETEYYGRYGYTRTAPTCTDPECGCREDLEDGDE